MFQVILKRRAEKGLKHLHPKDQKKVIATLNIFSQDPNNSKLNTKKLKGYPKLERAFRLRIGQIRIIYELFNSKKTKTIVIHFIGYRQTTTYS